MPQLSTWIAALALVIATPALVNADPVSMGTPFFEFRVSPENGTYEIQDQLGGVVWRSNPLQVRFGEIAWRADGKVNRASLAECKVTRTRTGLELLFQPRPEDVSFWVRVTVQSGTDQKSLDFSFELAPGFPLESIHLLDNALWVTDRDQGYVVVPVREGMLIRADSQKAFTHRFDTFAYEGCHMAMMGVVKNGASALVTWTDPYVAVDIQSVRTNAVWVQGEQIICPSLTLNKTARSCRIRFLGQGDYVAIAKAYRDVAAEKGWLVKWEEKLKGHPERAELFGAINYKLWSTLDRQMNEASTTQERVTVNWTFEEAAQIAEHLKRDLRLDKVLFTLGGWIHRGYDNQHPDILPSAAECGGDAALADCAQRVRQLGYVFCLHDNYQDIYRDAPSWDEKLIMKKRDGALNRGGHWAGGLAYLICSEKAVELAKRPQNLPGVKQLCNPSAYFIDTTYATGLQECFDPNHPLTRNADMRWKQSISDYARDLFGVFGSECGREWAIPHSDFFEGLTGVSGQAYHDAGLVAKVGGAVVPLFEMVYRDCIAAYGKYGYDPAHAAAYVLHHLTVGRPLHYHNIPSHLYWQQSASDQLKSTAGPQTDDAGIFTRADGGWGAGLHPLDRFVKNTAEILSPLHETTARLPVTGHSFLTSDGKVQRTIFGTGSNATHVIVNAGMSAFRYQSCPRLGEVLLPAYGFVVDGPGFAAFNALEFAGLTYTVPTLFTLRSVDGLPLPSSARVRVFHGFGEPGLRWGGATHHVERETVLPNARN